MTERSSSKMIHQIGLLTLKWAEKRGVLSWYTPETSSTNTFAKHDQWDSESLGKVYLTEWQSEGLGRNQRSWHSTEIGHQLLSSWSLPCVSPPQPILGPLLGLALYEALSQTWPQLKGSLKAPNDLFIQDKKAAGLLTEIVSRGRQTRLVVGLGLNVTAHPLEIPTATHLTSSLGTNKPLVTKDWYQFLDLFWENLHGALAQGSKPYLDPSERQKIREALNRYPLLTEPYTEVSPQGDLISEKGKISWHEL